MKEYLLLIRNEKDAKNILSKDTHLEFIKKCEVFIEKLKHQNKLIAAQPLLREGILLTKRNGEWIEKSISTTEIQVGYYHIMAQDGEEALAIAKENPEFQYVPSASIEVRQIKTLEKETGFVYPKENSSSH